MTVSASAPKDGRLQVLLSAADKAAKDGRAVSPHSKKDVEVLRGKDIASLVDVALDQGISADEFVRTLDSANIKLTRAAAAALKSDQLRQTLSPTDGFEGSSSVRGALKTVFDHAKQDLKPLVSSILASAVSAGAAGDEAKGSSQKLRELVDEATSILLGNPAYKEALVSAKPGIEAFLKASASKLGNRIGADVPLAPETGGVAPGSASETPNADLLEKTFAGLRSGGFAEAIASVSNYVHKAAENAAGALAQGVALSGAGTLLARSSPHLKDLLPIIGNATNVAKIGAAADAMWKAAKTGTPAERLVTSAVFVALAVGMVPGGQAVGKAADVAQDLWNARGATKDESSAAAATA